MDLVSRKDSKFQWVTKNMVKRAKIHRSVNHKDFYSKRIDTMVQFLVPG